jgi:hypothetical protein
MGSGGGAASRVRREKAANKGLQTAKVRRLQYPGQSRLFFLLEIQFYHVLN